MLSSSADVSTYAVLFSSERFIGRVKWFNNKAGYGFITVTDGLKSGSDVFVHHSSIKVDSEQYKYLVQGEYVEFCLSETMTETHEFQAGEVSGIKGGKLMCETRRDLRSMRNLYNSSKVVKDTNKEEVISMPRSVKPPSKNYKTQKIKRDGPQEDSEWTPVNKSKRTDKKVVRRSGVNKV
jgi:CspA family cold shock protein